MKERSEGKRNERMKTNVERQRRRIQGQRNVYVQRKQKRKERTRSTGEE